MNEKWKMILFNEYKKRENKKESLVERLREKIRMAFLPGNRITGINIKARFANDLHLATTQAKVTVIV
jgi:hypothetical protein